MIKSILLFCMILFASAGSFAQELLEEKSKVKQVFYMRDGSKMIGEIIETTPNGMWIALNQGADVYLPYQQMKRMKPIVKEYPSFSNQRFSAEKKSFFKEFHMGMMTGTPLYNNYSYMYDEPEIRGTFHGVVGKRFNDFLGLGLGVGMDGYETMRHFPIYLHSRYELSNGFFNPFFSLNAGYSLVKSNTRGEELYQDLSGGFYFSPGFTFSWRLPNAALNIGIKYSVQQFESTFLGNNFSPWMATTSSFWPQPTSLVVEEQRFAKRVAITIGLSF